MTAPDEPHLDTSPVYGCEHGRYLGQPCPHCEGIGAVAGRPLPTPIPRPAKATPEERPRAESSVHVSTRTMTLARRIRDLGLDNDDERIALGAILEMANLAFDEGYIHGLGDADERPRTETPLRARPLEEWSEDIGPVLWWNFPVAEPPYVGTPIDDDWPVYKTFWTTFTVPEEPR